MSQKQGIVLFVMLALIAAGCGGGADDAASKEPARKIRRGMAYIDPPKDSDSEFLGTAIFINEPGQLALQIDVENAPKGKLMVHIHQGADCATPGGRWNPDGVDRAAWEEGVTHLGQIGEFVVDAEGKGSLTLTTGRWSMGSNEANDVMGQTMLIFEAAEDAGAEPLGCGVIKVG